MSAQIIDGKALAATTKLQIKQDVEKLRNRGIAVSLTVILVGDNPASAVYVRNKETACKEAGMISNVIRLSADTTQEEVLSIISKLNEDSTVHGILVQLPLPPQIDAQKVIERISPLKDVDGFHVQSAGSLLVGQDGFVSCTPRGIIQLIESTGQSIEGKHAVVVGRSNIVGKPCALLLLQKNATVTVCHSKTRDMAAIVKTADIIVAAVGKANVITADMIKPGAIVIDVGMNRVNEKLVGDVDFESVSQVAGYITPVPGGVGPMTIAMLLKNTVKAGERYA